MYYKTKVKGVARIPPKLFEKELSKAVTEQLKDDYVGQITADLGKVIAILEVKDISEGTLIAGDGAAYYKCIFTVLHFEPEINELVEGDIKDIAKFGAFIDFGPFEGMVHISQTMDDFVSFSKSGSLTGKESNKSLKVGDKVRARIVAISYKDPRGPKIGLTMRQPYLGKLEWIEEQIKAEKKAAKKAAKKEK
ncbi:DNA-directed RNA polymerase [Candidatus Woesearchaeota archaeon]|nr:DNA-directed RNA polymerase [Candidatus Woesearchaeota archaeon]